MTTVEKPEYKVIGTRPIRPDGVEKVTGRAQYGADIRLPGLIHGRILRSPHAHARILSIDASNALATPGVLAVITGPDIPGRYGPIPVAQDETALAIDKVRERSTAPARRRRRPP